MDKDKRIRILMLYSAATYGGLIRNLSLIANNIDTTRFSLTSIALSSPTDSGNMLEIFQRDGISIESLEDTSKVDLTSLKSLAQRIRLNEFDVISAHGHKADFYALLLRYFYRINLPIFTIAHGWVLPGLKMKLYDWIDKFSMRFFDRVVLVHKHQLEELPFFPKEKTEVISNAITISPEPSIEQYFNQRRVLKIEEEQLAIGFCGRLSPEKGVAKILRAFSQMENKKSKLFICGDGPERDSLCRLAQSCGVEERVEFLGFVDDVMGVLAALDIYCSCSQKEGLPNNVLEAQLASLPCVLSDIVAHRQIVDKSQSAILVNTEVESEVISAFNRLAADKSLRNEFGMRARKNVEANFSIEKRIEKLQRAYSELVT